MEVIVTFALIALFMGSASIVLSSFMKSHAIANAVAKEQNVAVVVMETITDKLSAAKYQGEDYFKEELPSGEAISLTEAERKKTQLLITGGGSVVWFIDMDSGNAVKMYLEEGHLVLDYFGKDEEGNYQAPARWQLGANVYNGCTLERFLVEQVPDSSCLTVTIILKNEGVGAENSFSMERTLECYNLSKDNITVL